MAKLGRDEGLRKAAFRPIRWVLDRPVTMTMVLVLAAGLGAIAFLKISRQIYPNGFDPKFMYVQIYGFQLQPEETDRTIAEPLSGLFKTIKGIDSIRTRSSEGRLGIPLRFKSDTDMNAAYLELISRLERGRSFLPEEARWFVWRFNPDSSPFLWLGLQFPEEKSAEESKLLYEQRIEPHILRVDGVAKVEAHGFRSQRATVRLNEALLRQHQVTPRQVLQAIRQHDTLASLGDINDIPVILSQRLGTPDELREVLVKPGLRLRHLGSVELQTPPRRSIIRIDGDSFYWMSISKQDGANVIEVAEKVSLSLQELEQRYPGKVAFKVVWDEASEVKDALRTIMNTGMFAGLIAFGVVFLFLRDLRVTILVSTAIPLSILTTVTWLYFSDQTLNVLSMMGLMLACGMVVDNGIVVAEAVFERLKRRSNQQDVKSTIVDGVHEVALPVFMGTMTTIAVFLPLILMTGGNNFSFFMQKIGMPVCVALLVSLAIALAVIPFMISVVNKRGKPAAVSAQQEPNPPNPPNPLMSRVYRPMLQWSLTHKALVTLLVATFAALTFFVDSQVGTKESLENNSRLRFTVRYDDAIPFHQREEHVSTVESILETSREAFSIQRVRMRLSRNGCCANFRLQRSVEQSLSNKELRDRLQEVLPVLAGVEYRFQRGDEGRDGFQPTFVNLRLKGPSLVGVKGFADQIKAQISKIPGVELVELEKDDQLSRNVDIVPIPERTSAMSSSASIIAREVRARLAVTSLFSIDEKYPIEVAASTKVENLEQIRSLEVSEGVPIRAVAELQFVPQSETPRRENGALSQKLTVYFDENMPPEEMNLLRDQVRFFERQIALPPGYTLGSDDFRIKSEEDRDALFSVIMAVILVFLIMGVLFESAVLPFIVLFTVPMAFLGAMWPPIITGIAGGIMANLGTVILIGIVVNNGIVLIDRIVRDRREHPQLSLEEVVVGASSRRLRPVVMTAATTVFGLMPMAIGSSNIVGIPFAPLGHAIVGGLAFSTLVTLFLVPVVYVVFDRCGTAIRQVLARRVSGVRKWQVRRRAGVANS